MQLKQANFPVSSKRAISGHSMGGHGALTIAMKNPDRQDDLKDESPCSGATVGEGKRA